MGRNPAETKIEVRSSSSVRGQLGQFEGGGEVEASDAAEHDLDVGHIGMIGDDGEDLLADAVDRSEPEHPVRNDPEMVALSFHVDVDLEFTPEMHPDRKGDAEQDPALDAGIEEERGHEGEGGRQQSGVDSTTTWPRCDRDGTGS